VYELSGHDAVVKIVNRRDTFEDELNCYRNVGAHPNICQLLGSSATSRLLVLERLKPLTSKRIGAMDMNQRVVLLLGIARGLQHMHTMGQAHLDLKLSNLAIDERDTVKIIDLGGAKPLGEILSYASGTPGHRPKIQAHPTSVSQACSSYDIFAFGTVIASVLSSPKRLSFKDFNQLDVLNNLSNNSLKKQNEAMFSVLYDTAMTCIKNSESTSMDDVIHKLVNSTDQPTQGFEFGQKICGFKASGIWNTCYANALIIILCSLLKQETFSKHSFPFRALTAASQHLQSIATVDEVFDTSRVLAELEEFAEANPESAAKKFTEEKWKCTDQNDAAEILQTIAETIFPDRYELI